MSLLSQFGSTGTDARAQRRLYGFGLLAALAVFFLIFPQIPGINPYQKTVVLGGFFWAIMSASWALLAGVAGQFSFAHMGFVAIASYSAGLLSRDGFFSISPSFFSPVVAILIGGVVTGLIGIVVGWLLLRLRSSYLALFTIAFSEIIRKVIVAEEPLTGGMNGLSLRPLFDFGGSPAARVLERDVSYYIMFALLVVSLILMYLLANSRIGLFLRAMREDEGAAAALGVNVVRYKIFIFTFTAVLIGITGSIFFSDVGAERISPDALRLLSTSLLITYAVLGGMESMLAAAAGAFISRLLLEVFRELPLPFGIQLDYDVFSLVFLGIVIIVLVLLMWFARRILRRLMDASMRHWHTNFFHFGGLALTLVFLIVLRFVVPNVVAATTDAASFFDQMLILLLLIFALWQLTLILGTRLANLRRSRYYSILVLVFVGLVVLFVLFLNALLASQNALRFPVVGINLSYGASSFEPGFWRYAVFGIVMILTLRFMRNGLLYPVLQWFEGRDVAMQETVSIRNVRADDDFGDEEEGG